MGQLHKRVKVSAESSATVRMLVDTSATYSVISKTLARDLGIEPIRSLRMTLADGRRMKVDASVAVFKIGNREAPATIVIGDVAEPILGATTLEVLGLAVDRKGRRLTPTRPYTVRLSGVG